MAYGAVSGLSDPIEDYPNYWLKFYEQGTTTPLAMATDSSGAVTLAKAEISAGGTVPAGFIKTAGDVIFIPFINAAYDAFLFPTAAEADANDTSNAVKIADDITAPATKIALDNTKFPAVSDLIANTTGYPVGTTAETASFRLVAPEVAKGGAQWTIVATGGTPTVGPVTVLGSNGQLVDAAGNVWEYSSAVSVDAGAFGMVGDATPVLNGFGIPSSWTGTNNSPALQNAVDFARSNSIFKVDVPAGNFGYLSTVNVPVFIFLNGSGSISTNNVPLDAFGPSGTPIIRMNNTNDDIDGVFIDNMSFQMNGLVVDNCIGLQLYRVNTLAAVGRVSFTQIGSNSVGLDIFRGSSLMFNELRFNGGRDSGNTAYVGTNMRIRNCAGVHIGLLNLEHADVGIDWINDSTGGIQPVDNPGLHIDAIYCEYHETDVIRLFDDGTRPLGGPIVSIDHLEFRAGPAITDNIINVIERAGAGTTHSIALTIGSLSSLGSVTNLLKTPTREIAAAGVNILQNFTYENGRTSTTINGVDDRLSQIEVVDIGSNADSTTTRLEIHATVGGAPVRLGVIEVETTTGRLNVFGDNGLRLAPTGTLGFFGDSGTTQPTGVPVTAAGIHAALVSLGLITA